MAKLDFENTNLREAFNQLKEKTRNNTPTDVKDEQMLPKHDLKFQKIQTSYASIGINTDKNSDFAAKIKKKRHSKVVQVNMDQMDNFSAT